MSTSPPANQRLIFGSLVFSLAAICLLVNLAGVARLAYDVVAVGALDNLFVKALILGLVFWFGLGLGIVSLRRFQSPAFPQFARIYTWTYLALASLTYLGITLRTSSHDYSLLLYGAFIALLLYELIGVLGLHLVMPDRSTGFFAIPILAIVLFHLVVIVYLYVFASAPLSLYLAGDLFLLLMMSAIGSALLGENAFRSIVERLIDKIG
jgi:hypothetical protein